MRNILWVVLFTLTHTLSAQFVKDFSLPSAQGANVSLNSYSGKKAVVVVFTSAHCSFSTKYENRLRNLNAQYSGQGVQFLAVNSNDGSVSEGDNMQTMRQTSPFAFPYLKDDAQTVAKLFNAGRTPEVFVLMPAYGGQFEIVYCGAIDDNALDEAGVKNKYLANALDKIIAGQKPAPSNMPAQGCNIKWTK